MVGSFFMQPRKLRLKFNLDGIRNEKIEMFDPRSYFICTIFENDYNKLKMSYLKTKIYFIYYNEYRNKIKY